MWPIADAIIIPAKINIGRDKIELVDEFNFIGSKNIDFSKQVEKERGSNHGQNKFFE